jgi:ADP-ribose pyrophosphatase YjhB (NUDIX family)
MITSKQCPVCGTAVETYKNPIPAADVVVVRAGRILLIERRNPPPGWAIPGGFIEYGESAEDAAVRELFEETGLRATELELLGVYSKPLRDPRFHTLTVVYLAQATGDPVAGDDAASATWFPLDKLPTPLAFDHDLVIADAIRRLSKGLPA